MPAIGWSLQACSSSAPVCAFACRANGQGARIPATNLKPLTRLKEEAVMRREIFSSPLDRTQPGPAGGFNLSRWAIDHGGFTAFLLVLLLAAGVLSFIRIGQKEDPDFTFRVMVVQVQWPGATVEEMQEQVVDKIERKLQETPGLDFIRSYTRSGLANIFVNLKGSIRGDAVREAFYQARKKVGDIRETLPDGVIGPLF